jgi:hypothetical protein
MATASNTGPGGCLYVNTSTISGAGQGLFTKRALNPNEVIAWYEGPVHRVEDCIDSDYCASRAGVWHVDGKNISRYANDAYKSKLHNNARMEWIAKENDGFAWPFLMVGRRGIEAGGEILFSYSDTYWSARSKCIKCKVKQKQAIAPVPEE